MIRLMLAVTTCYLWKLRFLRHEVQEQTPAWMFFLRSDDVKGTFDLMGGFQ